MNLNYIVESITNIMMLNLIGIIILTLSFGVNMLCELIKKKYARKLMDKATQTEFESYKKYSDDDLENTYDASNNSIYNDASYQYTKKLKTRSRC